MVEGGRLTGSIVLPEAAHRLRFTGDGVHGHLRDPPVFSDLDRRAQLCRAGARTEGAQVWGAFVSRDVYQQIQTVLDMAAQPL